MKTVKTDEKVLKQIILHKVPLVYFIELIFKTTFIVHASQHFHIKVLSWPFPPKNMPLYEFLIWGKYATKASWTFRSIYKQKKSIKKTSTAFLDFPPAEKDDFINIYNPSFVDFRSEWNQWINFTQKGSPKIMNIYNCSPLCYFIAKHFLGYQILSAVLWKGWWLV